MEFFIADPNVERLPPDKTRFLNLQAEPYPDGTRLRVSLELTPFQQRPTIELMLTSPDGSQAAAASIIEPMAWKLELTLHIRDHQTNVLNYTLTASLHYPELGELDRREIPIDLSSLNKTK
jgi:hypothetical protein